MKALAAIALCATAGMGMAADTAAAKKVSRATCYGAGKTLLATEQVRVSAVVTKGKRPELSTARYYACNQTSRQRFLLFKGGEFENSNRKELVSPAIAGTIVAFQRAFHGPLSCDGPVVVFDAKHGRVMRKSTRQPGCIHGLVITFGGSAAWGYGIENDGDYFAALDSSGTRVLAHAGRDDPPLDVYSLHLQDGFGHEPDVAIWIQNDQKMTEELK
jgi:hypothetical protein